MLAVVGIPSQEARPPRSGEDTLFQELLTTRLLWPHVLVGYQWSHTGFCPGDQASHNRYIRSFVSQPPPEPDRHVFVHPALQTQDLHWCYGPTLSAVLQA